MKNIKSDVIGNGLQLDDSGGDNARLIEVNEAIRNHPVEEVGETRTVGSHERHVARSFDQLYLHQSAVLPGFGKTGGVHHCSANTGLRQVPHRIDGGAAGHGDEGQVGWCCQFGGAAHARDAAELIPPRVDDVIVTRESERAGIGNTGFQRRAADEGNRPRIQQTGKSLIAPAFSHCEFVREIADALRQRRVAGKSRRD